MRKVNSNLSLTGIGLASYSTLQYFIPDESVIFCLLVNLSLKGKLFFHLLFNNYINNCVTKTFINTVSALSLKIGLNNAYPLMYYYFFRANRLTRIFCSFKFRKKVNYNFQKGSVFQGTTSCTSKYKRLLCFSAFPIAAGANFQKIHTLCQHVVAFRN